MNSDNEQHKYLRQKMVNLVENAWKRCLSSTTDLGKSHAWYAA